MSDKPQIDAAFGSLVRADQRTGGSANQR